MKIIGSYTRWLNYTSPYYLTTIHMLAYEAGINVLSEKATWPTPEVPIDVKPPSYDRAPRRPRVTRIRVHQESGPGSVSRKRNRCGNCGVLGHNVTPCKERRRERPVDE